MRGDLFPRGSYRRSTYRVGSGSSASAKPFFRKMQLSQAPQARPHVTCYDPFMVEKRIESDYPQHEAEQRRDELVKRLLHTPPTPRPKRERESEKPPNDKPRSKRRAART